MPDSNPGLLLQKMAVMKSSFSATSARESYHVTCLPQRGEGNELQKLDL